MSELTPTENYLSAPKLPETGQLLADLKNLIVNAQTRVFVTANREQTLLYWDLGRRLRDDIFHESRAPYGEQIVSTLSRQLVEQFGKGYSRQNRFRTMQVVECFPDRALVEKLTDVVGWSHFAEV